MKNNLVQTFFTTKEDGDMRFSLENRINFLKKHGLFNNENIFMEQIHGSEIVVVKDDYETTRCDGLITNNKGINLFVFSADCFPVLFFDPVKEVIAVVHAGRNGIFKNISGKMIQKFCDEFHSNLTDIYIEIGPGANVCCYEVCAESNNFCCYVKNNFGESYVKGRNIDLLGINKKQLLDSGILEKNISYKNICTICEGDNYFSFRNGDKKERFAGIITLI